MKKINYIITLLLFHIVLFGQDKSESTVKLNELKAYVKLIDNTNKNVKEGISEGPIIYKKLFRKNGGWEAYFINDEKDKSSPLRIRYSSAEYDKNTDLNLYYKGGKLVAANLTITFTSGKNKRKLPYNREFYFPEERLQWQSKTDAEEFKELESNYSFEYLFDQERLIRKMVYE